MNEFEDIANLVEQHRDSGVEFGGAEDAPTEEWIVKAEQRLGVVFPPSYRWFLKSYGGGEIDGDEVFSIYQMEFEEVFGGDIVFKYLAHRKSGVISASEIPICESYLGELFVLESSVRDDSGEYPVYRKFGQERALYAATFAQFLERKINKK